MHKNSELLRQYSSADRIIECLSIAVNGRVSCGHTQPTRSTEKLQCPSWWMDTAIQSNCVYYQPLSLVTDQQQGLTNVMCQRCVLPAHQLPEVSLKSANQLACHHTTCSVAQQEKVAGRNDYATSQYSLPDLQVFRRCPQWNWMPCPEKREGKEQQMERGQDMSQKMKRDG